MWRKKAKEMKTKKQVTEEKKLKNNKPNWRQKIKGRWRLKYEVKQDKNED